MLPGANCGGCGFAGCRGLADALVGARRHCGSLLSGGRCRCMKRVAAYLGESAPEVEARRRRRCAAAARVQNVRIRTGFDGVRSCAVASALYAGETACAYGCLGIRRLRGVCAFDALRIDPGNRGFPWWTPSAARRAAPA